MLTVRVEDLGESVILHCQGKITRGGEADILCAALRARGRDIALDLTEVDAIDAAGMGALISLQAAGVYLRLLDPSRWVREVLRIAKLDSLFEICESTGYSRRLPHPSLT